MSLQNADLALTHLCEGTFNAKGREDGGPGDYADEAPSMAISAPVM